MLVKRIVAGIYGANCYLLMDEDTKEMGIIDPGGDSDDIIEAIERLNGKPKFILLTHGHVDHVGGVMDLKEKYNIPFYLNKEDEKLIKAKTYIYGDIPSADFDLQEDDVINLAKHEIKVIETPGHTPGGVCFLVDNMLFTGDTLFKGSIGRTDFGGGDYEGIMDSIHNKILPLGGHIKVMPGHGMETDLSYEKATNSFLR